MNKEEYKIILNNNLLKSNVSFDYEIVELTEKYVIIEITETYLKEISIPGYLKTIIKNGKILFKYEIVTCKKIEHFKTEFCKKIGIDEKVLTYKTRKREVVELKQLFCAAARKEGYSLSTIGKQIDKDHTTVLHGINQVNNIRELRKRFNTYYYGS